MQPPDPKFLGLCGGRHAKWVRFCGEETNLDCLAWNRSVLSASLSQNISGSFLESSFAVDMRPICQLACQLALVRKHVVARRLVTFTTNESCRLPHEIGSDLFVGERTISAPLPSCSLKTSLAKTIFILSLSISARRLFLVPWLAPANRVGNTSIQRPRVAG